MRYPPRGGVRGAPCTKAQTARALDAIAGMTPAVRLDDSLHGQSVIIAGNSPSLSSIPAKELSRYAVIGCNRGLRYEGLHYTHLVLADREPYCQERDSGRLEAFAGQGGMLLLSHSLFDPRVLLRGHNWQTNKHRLAQPPPEFRAYLFRIGTGGSRNAQARVEARRAAAAGGMVRINTDTFAQPLESGLNICVSMLQAAAIMRVARIYFIGIELKWKDEKQSHFYGSGRSVGAYPQNGPTVAYTTACLRYGKKALEQRGVEFINLSPVGGTPFAAIFGHGGKLG